NVRRGRRWGRRSTSEMRVRPGRARRRAPRRPQAARPRRRARVYLPGRTSPGFDHRHVVGAGLGQPDLAGPAQDLAYTGAVPLAREDLELFGHRIEAHDGVGAEIAQPDLVLIVDIDGVRARSLARQAPRLPAVAGRVVDADLTGIPLADPDLAGAVRPDAPC